MFEAEDFFWFIGGLFLNPVSGLKRKHFNHSFHFHFIQDFDNNSSALFVRALWFSECFICSWLSPLWQRIKFIGVSFGVIWCWFLIIFFRVNVMFYGFGVSDSLLSGRGSSLLVLVLVLVWCWLVLIFFRLNVMFYGFRMVHL